MPKLRVFVSSTAYDLAHVREQLKSTIESMGHHAVLSEFGGVGFDPSMHTQESCTQELSTCDVVVLVVGNRFGSETLADLQNTGTLEDAISENPESLDDLLKSGPISVTQLESLTAFKLGIPIFAFIKDEVQSDRRFLSINKGADISSMSFPSGIKGSELIKLDRFLKFIESRRTGNTVYKFSRLADISEQLTDQFSSWMQRLVRADRGERTEEYLLKAITEKIDDLKSGLATAFGPEEMREVASGVMEYRIVCEFIAALGESTARRVLDSGASEFSAAMQEIGYSYILITSEDTPRPAYRRVVYLSDRPDSRHGLRLDSITLRGVAQRWNGFMSLGERSRNLIYDSVERVGGRRLGLRLVEDIESTGLAVLSLPEWEGMDYPHPRRVLDSGASVEVLWGDDGSN